MYSLLKKILFLFDAEAVHVFTLKLLGLSNRAALLSLLFRSRRYKPITVMGIDFPNAVGLAAGLDKNACYIDALSNCGFGFIEVGTVTPKAQPGNDKPRLFRLEQDEAIINRMGFNNDGVDALLDQVRRRRSDCVLGINIGKNKNTPLEKAVDDYLTCMQKVYAHADYITINISSPNTPGLRELQHGQGLTDLLTRLKDCQTALEERDRRYVPLVVKIAPDLDEEEIDDIASRLIMTGIDAVIATNTTNQRPSTLRCQSVAAETGGLSGAPLRELSNSALKRLLRALDGRIPVIAAGGITSADDAVEKLRLGASLVQIYTGFIYHGPQLIDQCVRACEHYRQDVDVPGEGTGS